MFFVGLCGFYLTYYSMPYMENITMQKPFVAILMGSDSDLSTMQNTANVLKSFNIAYEIKIASAHRTPDATIQYIKNAEQRGCAIFVAAAGLAAHLAGAVAAHTLKPVIGVPIAAGSLGGFDSLLSTVQMPGGVPVACVAIGSPGAKNAGYLAAQILALSDEKIAKELKRERTKKAEEIQKKNNELEKLS
jgi:5-(carboxyamino)imidazole ribonucleotide mutase